jgi:hypothetical protein
MWREFVVFVLFGVLAVATLPLARVRFVLLALMHRGLHVAVVGLVVCCAFFFVAPDAAPAGLRSVLDAWSQRLIGDGPARDYVWLLTAGLLVAVSLPVLALLDFAQRLNGYSLLVRRLIRTLCEVGRSEAGTEAERPRPPVPVDDVETATTAIRSLASRPKPAKKRLADLLNP